MSSQYALDRLLDKGEEIDLTNDVIKDITNGKATIVAYHELPNYQSMDELLGEYGACILLYETRKNFGHWVALIQQNGFVEFFDSYGFSLDEELNYAKYNNQPYLTQLVESSGTNIRENKTRLQVFAEDVNTCGRWTSLRVVFRNMPLPQFTAMFKKNKHYNGDIWATALTYLFSI